MNHDDLKGLLEDLVQGIVSSEEAAQRLARGPFRKTELDFANLDHHRGMRHGIGEVVYGESKTVEQILAIAGKLAEHGESVLITRLNDEKLNALGEMFGGGRANRVGRTFIVNSAEPLQPLNGEPHVAIVAAGTSDLPVAEEACEVCVSMRVPFVKIYDVGVSGLHRVLAKVESLQQASALVVVAGMEGALPSVVGGLVGKPLFAVPTSVGYGASFGGLAALLGMLNSCAPGISVVNIDNGFSAAVAACNVARGVRQAASGGKR